MEDLFNAEETILYDSW